MLIQFFGILDLSIAILLIMARFGFEGPLVSLFVTLLMIKSLAFFGGLLSVLDILGGLYLISIVTGLLPIYPFIVWTFVVWFLQKGIFSFLH